jgi:hypothetical protein
MVASWEIWNECNARMFRNVVTMLFIVVSRIMGEALELGRGQAFELNHAAGVIILFPSFFWL